MSTAHRWTACGICCLLAVIGCQQSEQRGGPIDLEGGLQVIFKPMGDLLGLPDPVRVAITRDHLPSFSLLPDLSSPERFFRLGPLEQAPWMPLRQAMERQLKRPVHFTRSNYRGIRYHLSTGRIPFAMVSATEYAEITRRPVSQIVAVPVNVKGTTQHCGLIIVKKDSKIKSPADLKGKRFAFGPREDAILHRAALEALAKAGVTEKDIPKEIIPPFGYHINSYEIAKGVLIEGVPAGVVDELDFESWPEKSNILSKLSICQDRFRVIGRTEPVLEGPIIASVKAEPELVEQMQDLLINQLKDDKSVLGKLHYARFTKADPKMYQPLIDKLGIKPEAPTTAPADEDDELEPDPE